MPSCYLYDIREKKRNRIMQRLFSIVVPFFCWFEFYEIHFIIFPSKEFSSEGNPRNHNKKQSHASETVSIRSASRLWQHSASIHAKFNRKLILETFAEELILVSNNFFRATQNGIGYRKSLGGTRPSIDCIAFREENSLKFKNMNVSFSIEVLNGGELSTDADNYATQRFVIK